MKILVFGHNSYARPFVDEHDVVITHKLRNLNVRDYDAVVFTGGEDLNPALYEEEAHHTVHWNTNRDELEVELFVRCMERNIPTIGICRGMQLQTIMNGGKLVQHITNHDDNHDAYTFEGKTIRVNSLHHQLCVPKGNYKLLAWYKPTYKFEEEIPPPHQGVPQEGLAANYKEPEALWFPDTKCLGVQYHPEMLDKNHEGYQFFQRILNEFLS